MKKHMLLQYLVLTLSIFIFWSCGLNQSTTKMYSNPVIAGDFADPSVIRVGDIYYSTGTSCDFAPNYPIYESKDLINWELIGSVFNDPPAWAADDFWAPELFYKDGIFYVYYTAKRKDNRIACIGVATTDNMRNGFTDHGIIIEWGEEAIDAFVFQDEDDKLYITWKAYGLTEGRDIEILGSELSVDGMLLEGDHFTLTDHTIGWQGAGDEGQVLLKRGEYYYLFYSIGGCCDNRCDYRVKVSRSKKLKSGWEQYPESILHRSEKWLCTGHGTLVTTPDNRYFYLYHSYNATDFEYIGRQGMLDEMMWDSQTGWPYFKNSEPSSSAPVPFINTAQNRDSVFIDDFSNDKNLTFWEWDINTSKPSIALSNGEIEVTTNHNGISFLGLRPKTGDYSLMSQLVPSESLSGIGVYSNEQNFLAIAVNQSELILYQVKDGFREIFSRDAISITNNIYLKYESKDGRYFQFFRSENGKCWTPVASQVDGTFIAQWGYSPRVGFIMEGMEGSVFRYSEIRVEYKY